MGMVAGANRPLMAEGDFQLPARQLTPQACERDQRLSGVSISLAAPVVAFAGCVVSAGGEKDEPTLSRFLTAPGHGNLAVMANQAHSLRKAIENLVNVKLYDALAKPGADWTGSPLTVRPAWPPGRSATPKNNLTQSAGGHLGATRIGRRWLHSPHPLTAGFTVLALFNSPMTHSRAPRKTGKGENSGPADDSLQA